MNKYSIKEASPFVDKKDPFFIPQVSRPKLIRKGFFTKRLVTIDGPWENYYEIDGSIYINDGIGNVYVDDGTVIGKPLDFQSLITFKTYDEAKSFLEKRKANDEAVDKATIKKFQASLVATDKVEEGEIRHPI